MDMDKVTAEERARMNRLYLRTPGSFIVGGEELVPLHAKDFPSAADIAEVNRKETYVRPSSHATRGELIAWLVIAVPLAVLMGRALWAGQLTWWIP